MIYQIITLVIGVFISLIVWSENYKALGDKIPTAKFTILSCLLTSMVIIMPLAVVGIVVGWLYDMYSKNTVARPTVPTIADIKELNLRVYPLWAGVTISTLVTVYIF